MTEGEPKRPRPYAALLMVPGIRWQAILAWQAQLTQGTAALGIILVVSEAGGSLAVAGAVTAGLYVSASFARPVQGRLIDRHGAAPVLRVCALLHTAALVAFVVAARAAYPAGVLIVLGGLSGLGLPPVSISMRAAWGQLALDGDRTAAYSVVFLTQELAIVVGPLGLGVLVALTSASIALATVAVVTGVGTFALSILIRRTANAVPNGPHVTVLRSSAMRSLLAVTALVGAAQGGLSIGVPTFATAHGTPGASGLLVAGLSVGGMAGGLIYGAVSWRTHPANRYFALLASLAVALALLLGIESLPLLAVTLVVAGLAFIPVITTTSLLVDLHVRAAAEGFGWLSTAIGVGTAAGSAISGIVAEKGGARSAFVIAAVSAFAAVLICALTRRRLRVV